MYSIRGRLTLLLVLGLGLLLLVSGGLFDTVGELAWRPDIGSKFWRLKHRNNDGTIEGLAIAYAYEALSW